VLRETRGWEPLPYQWAVAGYDGAIRSGKTICGTLLGGTVYLGYLQGQDAEGAPEIGGERRTRAIQAVGDLYAGFIERFGDTDCQTLTGCHHGKPEDVERYNRERIYEQCFDYFGHVVAKCLEASDPTA
jgi:hypothetical protein